MKLLNFSIFGVFSWSFLVSHGLRSLMVSVGLSWSHMVSLSLPVRSARLPRFHGHAAPSAAQEARKHSRGGDPWHRTSRRTRTKRSQKKAEKTPNSRRRRRQSHPGHPVNYDGQSTERHQPQVTSTHLSAREGPLSRPSRTKESEKPAPGSQEQPSRRRRHPTPGAEREDRHVSKVAGRGVTNSGR